VFVCFVDFPALVRRFHQLGFRRPKTWTPD
jgi:hypothetical protein